MTVRELIELAVIVVLVVAVFAVVGTWVADAFTSWRREQP